MLEKLDARKERIGAEQALALLSDANSLVVVKGKKVNRYDLRENPPAKEELLKQVMGPSGNLRAPTIRRGKSFVVGFQAEAYKEFFQ